VKIETRKKSRCKVLIDGDIEEAEDTGKPWPTSQLLPAWGRLRRRLLRIRAADGPRTAALARLFEDIGRVARRGVRLPEGEAAREDRMRRALCRAYKGIRVLTERDVSQRIRWLTRAEITALMGRMAEMGAVERVARVNAQGREVEEWRKVDREIMGTPDYGLVRLALEELERALDVRWVGDGVTLRGEFCLTDVSGEAL
jgi:hypothetical protein